MIIENENNVPTQEISEPYKRTLKLLLSPTLHKELKGIAAGLTILPPGGKSEEADHMEGEMFYVISGSGLIGVDNEEAKLTIGTAVWVPPFVSHYLLNNSDKTLKILWVLSPPGREASIIENSV